MRFVRTFLTTALLTSAATAMAADNWTIKDASGAPQTFRALDLGGGLKAQIVIPGDQTGAPITGQNPLAVSGVVGIGGYLPAFAAPPTVTLGAGSALPTGAATSALQSSTLSALGAPAQDATLTGGGAKTINRGGVKGTTAAADVTSTASGANHQPLDVMIYDASGNPITSFGNGSGGTVTLGAGSAIAGKFGIDRNAQSLSATGALSASGDNITLSVDGMQTLGVRVPSGTWSGSISVTGSADGTNYDVPLTMIPYSGGSAAPVSVITSGGYYEISIPALVSVKVSASTAITNGPVTVLARAATGNKSIRVGAPVGSPVPVATPTLSTFVASQVTIVTTGTAVQLPSSALINGVVVTASPFNAAQTKSPNYSGAAGPSSSVTTKVDGSAGAGYPLAPGQSTPGLAVANANAIWVNGSAGDVFSYAGN